MPPISPRYQFLMWFSGLRGGVAFAIASVGFAQRDFTSVRPTRPPARPPTALAAQPCPRARVRCQACGGLTEAQLEEALAGRGAWVGYCDTPGMSDSLAVLQVSPSPSPSPSPSASPNPSPSPSPSAGPNPNPNFNPNPNPSPNPNLNPIPDPIPDPNPDPDPDPDQVPEPLAIRGYTLVKQEQRELAFAEGTHVVDDPGSVDCGSCGVQ